MSFDQRLAIRLCEEADYAARHVAITETPLAGLASLGLLGARIVALQGALDARDAEAVRWAERLATALVKCNYALGAELAPVRW